MIKIIKLKDTHIDSAGHCMDVFYVKYSDSKLISTGDFVLDNIDRKMTCENIERYFETDIYKKFDNEDNDMLIKHVNSLIYRMSNYNQYYEIHNGLTENYLEKVARSINRDNKLSSIL